MSDGSDTCSGVLVNVKYRTDGRQINPQQRSESLSTDGSDYSDFSQDSSTSFKLGDTGKRVSERSRRAKFKRTVIIVVCGFFGVVLISAIVTTVVVPKIIAGQERPKLCLPCSEVTLTSYEENARLAGVDKTIQNNRTMCCAKNDAMVALLLDYVSAEPDLICFAYFYF